MEDHRVRPTLMMSGLQKLFVLSVRRHLNQFSTSIDAQFLTSQKSAWSTELKTDDEYNKSNMEVQFLSTFKQWSSAKAISVSV